MSVDSSRHAALGVVREAVREVDVFSWRTAAIVAVVLLAWYLSYSASRLDRLHHKVEAARATLDAQLVRRSAAAIEVAAYLDPASALLVSDAAARSLGRDEDSSDQQADPLSVPATLVGVENDMSRVLHATCGDAESVAPLLEDSFARAAVDALVRSVRRVQLARRFYNDAVAQAVRVRHKAPVRWLRLAGHAPLPQMIDLDDEIPAGLVGQQWMSADVSTRHLR